LETIKPEIMERTAELLTDGAITDTKNKDALIWLRVSRSEKAELAKQAKERKISVARLIREAVGFAK
jgi:hypothetical protein